MPTDAPRDVETFRRVFGLIERLVELVEREPVTPYASPETLSERLDLALGARGVGEDELFTQLEAIARETPRTTGRLFFNQLFAGRDAHAAAAEMLAAALNVSMYTFKVAGPHALIERELVGRMGALAGLGEGEGIFCPGGSMSNLAGMVMARNHALPGSKEHGLGGHRVGVYASDQCHYSIAKNAGILGFGRAAVRAVATDGRGRMDPEALRACIARDRAEGVLPVCVVATAGTTVLGAFDPIDAIADVAGSEGVWLHVDGALGGSALLSDAHRHLLAGSHRADSLAWNMHKMMGSPLSTSVVLTRERGPLTTAFSETATYLFQSDNDDLNAGTRSIQCGRGNDALKLWAMWKRLGDEGLGARVDHLFAMARHAADLVRRTPGLVLVREPASVTVCFDVEGVSVPELCEALRREGRTIVGYAIVDERPVIRLACVNPSMTTGDLDDFFAHVGAVVESSRAVAC